MSVITRVLPPPQPIFKRAVTSRKGRLPLDPNNQSRRGIPLIVSLNSSGVVLLQFGRDPNVYEAPYIDLPGYQLLKQSRNPLRLYNQLYSQYKIFPPSSESNKLWGKQTARSFFTGQRNWINP